MKSGREPVVLVEIDQDQCTLTYGESPCTAVLGTTGDRKCFNTNFTCQDLQNYDKGTLTLRFCEAQAEVPFSWGAIPSLLGADTTPTQINPGGGDRNRGPLGSRSSVRIQFQDHPHSDFRVDKYRDERLSGVAQSSGVGYEPQDRGTFWTKWLARNPYWLNRRIRIREGYLDQDPADMVTRHYIIKDISGPDSRGRVTVTAEDVLRLADRENAQAPTKSEGILLTDISQTATSFKVVNWRSSDEYPSDGGTVRINDEVMTYDQATVSGDEIELTGVTRATDGTEGDDHDAEDSVQLCLRYTSENCWEVARQLLVDYASVPSEFIPFADWEAEAEIWLAQFTVTTLITEPEGVNTLLGEITEQCLFFIWWDERAQEIRLKALRPPTETPTGINDYAHVKKNSWAFRNDMDQRVSQVWVYYQQRDPTEDVDEPTNYRRLRLRINPNSEGENQYGERQVKRVYSRWLESAAQAINLSARLMARYRDGARYCKLRLDAKDRELWTGDVADVTLWSLVDVTGEPTTNRYQVISAEEVEPGETVEYDMLRYEFIGRYGFWMEDDAPEYPAASSEQREQGFWWSDANGEMSDGTDGWVWQ